MHAQVPAELVGTYNGSEMEVGTELRLEADGRYEYYLSYGALDETSEGTWTAEDKSVVLTSDPFRDPEFELLGMTPGNASMVQVTLDVPKEMPVQFFSALLLRPDHTASEVHFGERAVRVPVSGANHPSALVLGLEVFDVKSQIFQIPPHTRSMQFRFVANDLGKVAFDHQRLSRAGDDLVLERFGRMLRYRKETTKDADQGEKPREY
jgi:hypothetical protein